MNNNRYDISLTLIYPIHFEIPLKYEGTGTPKNVKGITGNHSVSQSGLAQKIIWRESNVKMTYFIQFLVIGSDYTWIRLNHLRVVLPFLYIRFSLTRTSLRIRWILRKFSEIKFKFLSSSQNKIVVTYVKKSKRYSYAYPYS